MSSTDLVATRQAIQSVSYGKQTKEDSWMTMWCNTNWGQLLQPAPLSIALLGSVLIIAASTEDFSLVTERDPTDTSPAFTWQYALFPDSFKTCLMQMVGDGYAAFEGAHTSMLRIQDNSSQIPGEIDLAVKTIFQGTPEEIRVYLGGQIDGVLQLANNCKRAAEKCETAFENIAGLAQELVLACTNKVGTNEQKLEANKAHLAFLQAQKEGGEIMLKQAEDSLKFMKESFLKAEEGFHEAVKKVPTAWDVMQMQIVDNLGSLVVSAGNAAISTVSLRPQVIEGGLSATSAPAPTSAPNGVNSQVNAAALTDPGLMQVSTALTVANAIEHLAFGGPDGKPDWTTIRGKDDPKNGGEYVKASLESLKSRLDLSKPISTSLVIHLDQGLKIINSIIRTSRSVGASDDALESLKPQISQLVSDLQQLVTTRNLLLQQTGTPATAPGAAQAPSSLNSSATKIAVETSKFTVDQTRANLESSRQSFQQAAERLANEQHAITKTIAEMTSMSVSNSTLEKMLPVLKIAVGAFTTLRAQFSQLLQFFHTVASLLTEVMAPSVDRWARAMKDSATLGGVTMSDLTRNMIYTQMMIPHKVSLLAEKISTTYLAVSSDYILPAQRTVGSMMKFADDNTPGGKAKFQASLTKAQADLKAQTTAASEEIAILVDSERKKFAAQIDARIETLVAAVKPVIPAITEGVPENIKQITDSHVKDSVEAQKALDKARSDAQALNNL